MITILLSGCEKNIDFKLDQTEPKLVVEATIENGTAPMVFLTRSFNYFSEITPALLTGSFVHGAVIKVSNGTQTHQLKEYTVPVINGFNLYYYSIDSANLATAFTGQLKTNYTLEINVDGKTYTSATTIPDITKKIDSIWSRPVPGDTSQKQVNVIIKVTDPPGFGDYVRYWTKRNSEPYLPGFSSVFDDYVIDGTTYELPVEPGIDRNAKENDFDLRSFKKGDTVTLKLSNIDKVTYDFWRTMEYTYSSIGNPFASPVKVINNISNGALGYFGGYASQYRTIIIPR
jgi:Domain of unknown function (DUF4249)